MTYDVRAEVRRLTGAVQAAVDRLDILISNAGVDTVGPVWTRAEAFELRFAVNYLAGFLLTLLLPFIKNSAPGATPTLARNRTVALSCAASARAEQPADKHRGAL